MKCKKTLIIAVLFVFFIGPVVAMESPVNRLQSKTVQHHTIRALQSIDQGQWDIGEKMVAGTRDSLAAKMYYWLVFVRKGDVSNYARLAQFIRQNPEWPGVGGLKAKAERSMPRDLPARDVVAWFADYTPKTAAGLDRYIGSLLAVGRKAQAKKIVRQWWIDMRTSRDEQKYIYKKYGSLLDHAVHKRRFDMLLFSKQYDNARAIAAVLGDGYLDLAEARIALARENKSVNALIAKVPAKLKRDPGLRYERLRWRRRNDMDVGAMEILNASPRADQISNPKAWWRERHILIRRLLEKKHYKSAYLLASTHVQSEGFSYAQAEWLSGWLALRFMNKPTEAHQHFTALYKKVKTPVSKARAAYWAGRAAEAFGRQDIANQNYKIAAKFQTVYYGQLAAAKLGAEKTLPHAAPPVLTAVDQATFKKRELIQAAQLFHAAGMRKESSRFLKAFVAQEKTPKAYRYAAESAAKMGRYYDAVRISKDATKQGLFLTAQAYPVITDKLSNVDVEWALVHGLIRQESIFDEKASSPVGAKGLMQLMPATAKETARKLGISHQTAWLTARPDHNITLGSAYLGRMINRFDGSYPLAIAAYNAGPGRVDRWLKTFGDPRKGHIDWIDWIELIPIYETRNYVQRVMEAVYVYRLRLKGVQKLSQPPIHIALSNK